MAISQTMSNPTDWMQFYQINSSGGVTQTEIPSTTVTTTTAAVSRVDNLSPDQGRVSKPIRRRSRASRRTPTTLLNTDTANFRAMVQQFTGGPAAPFAARPQPPSGGATFNFTQQMGPIRAAGVAPANGFHVQYQNQMLQPQQMYMIDNMHGGGRGGGGGVSSHAPPGSSSSTSETRNYENYML